MKLGSIVVMIGVLMACGKTGALQNIKSVEKVQGKTTVDKKHTVIRALNKYEY